jgi:hypothetical protein
VRRDIYRCIDDGMPFTNGGTICTLREVDCHVHLIYHDQNAPVSASICERRVTDGAGLYEKIGREDI